MRRSLAQLIDLIEAAARNKLEPRERIVELCDQARRTLTVRYDRNDPVHEAVMHALDAATVDGEGLVHLDGEYLTTMRLLHKVALPRTPGNLARVGKVLAGLGYVRLNRTRIHPQSRWFAPRALV